MTHNILNMDPIALMLKILAASACLLVLAGILAPILWYKRKKDLARIAAEAGAVFTKAGPDLEGLGKTGIGYFGLVTKTSNQIAFGDWGGAAARYFDGFYSTGSGKYSTRYDFTMALFEYKTGELPQFSLQPSEFFARLDELLGAKHVKLENAPGFSKKYQLDGADERALRDFFNSDIVAKLEEAGPLHILARGRYLAIYRGRALLPAGAYPQFIAYTKELALLMSR